MAPALTLDKTINNLERSLCLCTFNSLQSSSFSLRVDSGEGGAPCWPLYVESELWRPPLHAVHRQPDLLPALPQGSTACRHRPHPVRCLVLCTLWAKNGFYIFNWLNKTNQRRILCDLWQWHGIQISVSVTVLLKRSHSDLLTFCLWLVL